MNTDQFTAADWFGLVIMSSGVFLIVTAIALSIIVMWKRKL